MYARNLQEIANRMRLDDGGAVVDLDDEVVGPATITHDGKVVHPRTREVMGLEKIEEETT
jgi:hypothetical protein